MSIARNEGREVRNEKEGEERTENSISLLTSPPSFLGPSPWEKVAYELVGKPFLWGARGPEAYDCWGLVAEALNRVSLPVPPDLMLPDDTVEHTTRTLEQQIASPAWVVQTKPEPGDVVALSTNKRIHHVGVLTPWGVLHTLARCGAVISRERQLRDMGYQRIEYYRWAG